MDLLNKACFLDPRFKFLSFLSVEEKEVVTDSIFDEMVEGNLTVTGINEDVEPRPKKPKLYLPFWEMCLSTLVVPI